MRKVMRKITSLPIYTPPDYWLDSNCTFALLLHKQILSMKTFLSALYSIGGFHIYSCTNTAKKEQTADALVSHIDSTVKPGDDFFLLRMENGSRNIQFPPVNRIMLVQLIQDTINARLEYLWIECCAERCTKRQCQAKDRRFFSYRNGQYFVETAKGSRTWKPILKGLMD